MKKSFFILTGLFQLTALKVSGEYGIYRLCFLDIPWIRSTLEKEISILLSSDYTERCYLDPEAPASYAEWRDSLDKVGIGIQVWLVSCELTPGAKIWDTENHFPHSLEKPTFCFDHLEWGWRLNSSQAIEMQGCSRRTPEALCYKPLRFLASEVKPTISYTWPCDDRRDPRTIDALEAQLLSIL